MIYYIFVYRTKKNVFLAVLFYLSNTSLSFTVRNDLTNVPLGNFMFKMISLKSRISLKYENKKALEALYKFRTFSRTFFNIFYSRHTRLFQSPY